MSQSETPVGTILTRNRGWSKFLILSLILHLPLFVYPIVRLCGWLHVNGWLTLLILLPVLSSQIVSRLYLRGQTVSWARWYRRCADFCLGLSLLLLITLLIFEVIVVVTGLDTGTAAISVLSISFFLGFLGFINALVPMVKTIKLICPKLTGLETGQKLRFVQITDVHIGSRTPAFLGKVVSKINTLHPDFVCITGDFIDASGITENQLQSLTLIDVPIYFCIGNHEKYEDLEDIVQRLRNLGVTVLRNRSIEHKIEQGGSIQIIGIDDMDDALQVQRQLTHISVSVDDFVLLMYHRPRGLSAAAQAGVDLMLSGHTHNGQIFPFNLMVSKVFDRIEGLYKEGDTHLYVSQGTGTWGPIMRVGTRSEITLFEIAP